MTSRRDLRHGRHCGYGGRPPGGAGLLVRLWRWRTETILLTTVSFLLVTVVLSLGEGDRWPFLVLACTAGVLVASGFWRRWVTAHAWCLFSRHRIRRACEEAGIHTRSGRLPLILWITPSAAGEKALVLARAGTCAEDFDAFSAGIAAACCARDAVVSRHGEWANLLTVEIVRRDEATGPPVGLDRLYGRTSWVSLRADRPVETEDRPVETEEGITGTRPAGRFAAPLPLSGELPELELPEAGEFPEPGGFPEPREFPESGGLPERRRQAA
ncbi:hypothetical protein [Streptosporangium sp. NPDC002721]|uniref:hypothetical protein n=1 Tax=Streptosporangium sp. NPDC002721 TaxID=3366188 RepID=UPI0036A946ED